jgi:hypothetical protein
MNAHSTPGRVDFASDALQQALDDAASIVAAAEEEARYEVTRGEVLDHMSMNFTRADDKLFMQALRREGRQDIAMMLDLIQKSFKAVVAEKRSAILAKKAEPDDGIH